MRMDQLDKRIPLLPSLAKRRRRRILILCVVLGMLLLPVCGYMYLDYFFNGDHRVAMLNIDKHRKLEIRADNFWDPVATVWCQLVVYGKRSGSLGSLGYAKGTGDLSFDLLKSNDESIIAVVEQSNPDVLLFIHNFHTGQTYSESDTYYNDIMTIMQLQQDHPDKNLVLSSTVDPERKSLIRGY